MQERCGWGVKVRDRVKDGRRKMEKGRGTRIRRDGRRIWMERRGRERKEKKIEAYEQ